MKKNKGKTSHGKDLGEWVAMQEYQIKGGHFLLGIKLSSSFPSQMGPFEEWIGEISLSG